MLNHPEVARARQPDWQQPPPVSPQEAQERFRAARRLLIAGAVVFGAGVSMLGAGLGMSEYANKHHNDPHYRSMFSDLEAGGLGLAGASPALMAPGLICLSVGFYRYRKYRSSQRLSAATDPVPVRFVPYLTRDGGGIMATGRF